jgi:hypothetical protein
MTDQDMEAVEKLTGISLYAGSNFTSSNIIKESNILAEHSLQVAFSQSLGRNFPSVDPNVHINESAKKNANT